MLGTDGGGTDRHGGTILLCEDDADLLDELACLLREAGHDVVAVASAEAALARLGSLRPDVILSDIALPGTDGMSFLRHVRQTRSDLNDVPFIMLTGFADRSDIAAGKRAGADDYLVKPVDHDLLLATLDAQLRQVARIRAMRAGPDRDGIAAGLAQAVDRLDFGLVLLDAHGRICFANRAARRIAADPATTRRNWLSHAFGEAEFAHAIGAAHDNLRRGRCSHAVALISGEAAQDRWRLIVLSALDAMPARPDQPMMMGLIVASDDMGRLGTRLISDVAGLTAAEGSVAELLAQGLRLRDIADRLAISTTTVNFHLRNIFQKTATARQADLMLLMRSVPLADCRHCGTGTPGQARPLSWPQG